MKRKSKKVAAPLRKRVRLLIIDDSAAVREALGRLGSVLPHVEVIGAAANGIEGLALIRKLAPDIITLDLQMPAMSGIEVLKTIKAEGLKCSIIVLTAMADQSNREQCFALGADHVFDKITEFPQAIAVLQKL